jgi:hypothetical protein
MGYCFEESSIKIEFRCFAQIGILEYWSVGILGLGLRLGEVIVEMV